MAPPRSDAAWHARSAEHAAAELRTDVARGLTEEEARRRLREHGPNTLERRRGPGTLWRLLRQFTDVTVLALLVAALVAVLLGVFERADQSLLERFGDAIAIFAIVTLNALIGFFQERKAETALRALEDLSAPRARVCRDGKQQTLAAADLVPGDVVLLAQGDRVPADLRLVEALDHRISEAILTGESVPVHKHAEALLDPAAPLAERTNLAFMGTHVAGGRARALVVATGMHTAIGEIAGLLGSVETPETPLQKSLRRFGTRVVIGCVAVAAAVFVIGLWRLEQGVGFLLLTAVSLAVAAIPEGLPAITSIVLALGVQRMAKRKAVVRRLAAVETLGSVHIVCTDKTGTLTQNRMVVRQVWTAAGHARVTADALPSVPSLSELLLACRFAPEAHLPPDGRAESVSGDPTDAALLRLHLLHGKPPETWEKLGELPFDGERKLATVVGRTARALRGYTHGAPERVLELARRILDENGQERPLTQADRLRVAELIDAWASEGLRVLALARSERSADGVSSPAEIVRRFESDLTLLGLVAIADPPRAGVAEAVRTARAAGVKTVMITGDHELTARAIAGELGILDSGGEVVRGTDLEELSERELAEAAPRITVVARATALAKMQLVRALAAHGRVIAMTGDGVNDAPAMKAANIGIAMGQSGTDVAREAADLVLVDDNYATIIGAIKEGRVIYANIKRFILFLFTANAGLVLAVLVGALLGWPPLLTPTQILWINLITNGLPALALGMEPRVDDPMGRPPRPVDEPLITLRELAQLASYGTWMALLGLGIFGFWQMRAGGDLAGAELATARTMTFTVLALSPMFHSLNARSEQRSAFELGFFSNWRLMGAFAAAAALQAVAIYVPFVEQTFGTRPLSPAEIGLAVALAATVWLAGELHKLLARLIVRSDKRFHLKGTSRAHS